jgi:putative transposase
MYRVMKVHPSGFYAWKQTPDPARVLENRRLLGQIKQCWIQIGVSVQRTHIDLA